MLRRPQTRSTTSATAPFNAPSSPGSLARSFPYTPHAFLDDQGLSCADDFAQHGGAYDVEWPPSPRWEGADTTDRFGDAGEQSVCIEAEKQKDEQNDQSYERRRF